MDHLEPTPLADSAVAGAVLLAGWAMVGFVEPVPVTLKKVDI